MSFGEYEAFVPTYDRADGGAVSGRDAGVWLLMAIAVLTGCARPGPHGAFVLVA